MSVAPAAATVLTQAEVRAGLERVIERELEARPTTSEAERHLREMADELVARAMSKLRQPSAAGPPKPDEIDRLERRIAKLTAALEDTEARLARMDEERERDPGIRSSYRSVQGLRGTERDYERKMSLLRDILEANLDLQRKLATGGEPLDGAAPVPHEPVGSEPA